MDKNQDPDPQHCRYVSGFEKPRNFGSGSNEKCGARTFETDPQPFPLGSAVGGRVSFNSNDDHDAMDGELVCRVLQLMQLTDNRLTQVTGSYQNMILVDAKIIREYLRNSPKYTKVSDLYKKSGSSV
jgi:hypothetical protein